MRLIASNCIVPSTTLVDMYENLDGSPFDWDSIFPGFNNGDSQLRRKYMSVAIDQGSTVVTSTLECDTTKVMDAYRLRDPRLCLNVITPYSHYLGTDAVQIHGQAVCACRPYAGWSTYGGYGIYPQL